jgi:drug/metabolite transporter (DMT)-like permease
MRTWLAFLGVIVAWGSSYLFIRISVTSFTPVGLVATRFGIAAVLCVVIARLRGETFPRGVVAWRFAAVGILMMAGSNSLTAYAQQTVSSGIAGVVHSLSSIWLAALASFGAFGPSVKTPARAWLGIVLGVVGVAVMLWPNEHQARAETLGVLALLTATLTFAGASVLQRRTQALNQSGLFGQLATQMAGGASVAFLFSLFFGVLHAPLTSTSLAAIATLTCVASVGGFAAYAIVLRDWPPARAGSFAVVNPVVAVLLGVLVMKEPLTPRTMLGATMTLGAVAWVQWTSLQRRQTVS